MKQKCQRCKLSTNLIEAHIIPKSMLKGLHKNISKQSFLKIDANLPYTKRQPNGPYDNNILCAECDNTIGVYDNYAKSVLFDEIEKYKSSVNPVYEIPSSNIDYTKFKKFFISLIWRASVSDHDLFETVKLGPYNEIALRMLADTQELSDDIFGFIIFKDSNKVRYQDVITFTQTKLAGKRAYKTHFSGYQITIVPNAIDMNWKLAPNTLPPSVFFFKKNSPFLIFEIDEDLSYKDQIMRKVIKGHKAQKNPSEKK